MTHSRAVILPLRSRGRRGCAAPSLLVNRAEGDATCPPRALLSPRAAQPREPVLSSLLCREGDPMCPPSTLLSPRLSPPCAEEVAPACPPNRVLSARAEEDAEEACAPCGLLSSCAEEDAAPSARAPSACAVEEDAPTSCTTPTSPCALCSAWGDAPLSCDRSLGNKGLLGKGSLLLWPHRIGHNNTPLPALALSCCKSCCCLLSSLACQPHFILFHQPVDFFLAANLAILNLYIHSSLWACAFVL
jgi:hypothetical protein